jgi:parallel beta-helix repeat protein
MVGSGKTFTLLLVIIFLLALVVALSPAPVKAAPKTLIVPNEYPTIADAIGNASAGDTVFVKDGTYNIYELGIDVPLTLVGEDPQKTILLSSSWYPVGLSSAIEIVVNDVTVENFTIIGLTHISAELGNSPELVGILLQTFSGSGPQPSDCKIINNTVVNNYAVGILVSGDSQNNIVSGNNVTENWGGGISLESSNSIISNNNVTENNGTGVSIDSCKNVTVKQNNISRDSGGLAISYYGSFHVYQNDITDNNGFGLQFGENCGDSAIYDNNIIGNQVGIDLSNFGAPFGIGDKVYSNNLINNSVNAFVEHVLSFNPTHVSNGTDMVSWDKGKTGNYWSDYQSKYPKASEVDSSGIENTPYIIDASNTDYYPLVKQVNIFTTAPTLHSTLLITAIAIVVVVFAVTISLLLYYRRHQKPANLTNA